MLAFFDYNTDFSCRDLGQIVPDQARDVGTVLTHRTVQISVCVCVCGAETLYGESNFLYVFASYLFLSANRKTYKKIND